MNNDYSKYHVPRYKVQYIAEVFSNEKDETFDSLERALEYMRNAIKEENKEVISFEGLSIYFLSVENNKHLGFIEPLIIADE